MAYSRSVSFGKDTLLLQVLIRSGAYEPTRHFTNDRSKGSVLAYEDVSCFCSHSTGLPPTDPMPSTGGPDVIRKEAWRFYRTSSGVRLCWELKEPKGPQASGANVCRVLRLQSSRRFSERCLNTLAGGWVGRRVSKSRTARAKPVLRLTTRNCRLLNLLKTRESGRSRCCSERGLFDYRGTSLMRKQPPHDPP